VELLETRHVRDAFKAMPVKTDRKDARGIAQLMRLGWFRPVHCKSLPAQEVRALLTARKLLQTKNHDVDMSLRGMLRGFGLKVGPTTPRTFAGRVRDLVAGHTTLSTIAEALLAARGTLFEQWQQLEKRLRSLAREGSPGSAADDGTRRRRDRGADLCLGHRTGCWPTGQALSPTRPPPQPANKRRSQVRAVRDTGRPEQGQVAGTMDQVRPMSSQQGFATARF
jgi:hypothetical protein